MNVFEFYSGDSPLLISIPHAGTYVPPVIAERLTDSARLLPDTDWHLDQLYDWAIGLGASVLLATHSRYVVDLNRPPDDQRLYQTATTGLFPEVQFDGSSIYRKDFTMSDQQRQQRLLDYYQPYHQQLTRTIAQIRDVHGYAIVFDAHSIRSQVPRLFDGHLPDLNIGTNDGRSCAAILVHRLEQLFAAQTHFSVVSNGRFKGGYITRHYGQPKDNVHGIQLEIAQRAYMSEEDPTTYQPNRAAALQTLLRQWVNILLSWHP